MKCVRTEADHVLVTRAARRTEQMQVVDRLEEIRLPLPVFADQDEAVGRRV